MDVEKNRLVINKATRLRTTGGFIGCDGLDHRDKRPLCGPVVHMLDCAYQHLGLLSTSNIFVRRPYQNDLAASIQ